MIKGIVIGPFSYEDEQALLRAFGEFSLTRYGNTNHWGVYQSFENNQVTGTWLTFMIEATDGWTQGYTLPRTYVIYKDYLDKELKTQIMRALDKVGSGGLIRVADDTALMEFTPA
jgi:hypothetical protein